MTENIPNSSENTRNCSSSQWWDCSMTSNPLFPSSLIASTKVTVFCLSWQESRKWVSLSQNSQVLSSSLWIFQSGIYSLSLSWICSCFQMIHWMILSNDSASREIERGDATSLTLALHSADSYFRTLNIMYLLLYFSFSPQLLRSLTFSASASLDSEKMWMNFRVRALMYYSKIGLLCQYTFLWNQE